MPVRKIPKNYLCVTGSFASRKNRRMLGFESLLERDFMILQEFDDTVAGFVEQPVRIPVVSGKDRQVSYVPDLLIHYKPGAKRARKSRLVEVKARRDLDKNQAKYAPKFKAATAYAKEQGWQFEVVDDAAIRVARLPNLKFLREYHLIRPAPEDMRRVVERIAELGGWVELSDLLADLCADDLARLRLLPVIWHLVAIRRVHVDMDTPFTDRTPLTLPTHTREDE